MAIVIGIDVGISTTKIVGIKNGKVTAPISITAADPITSLYGAFGKYLHDNDIDLKDVEQVMLTGVGCRIYEKNIPIDYQTAVMAEEMNMNVTTCALNGGEDYELLFTVPIGDHEKIEQIEGIKLIGHITEEKFGKVLVTRDNQEFELKAQGWNGLSSESH